MIEIIDISSLQDRLPVFICKPKERHYPEVTAMWLTCFMEAVHRKKDLREFPWNVGARVAAEFNRKIQ